MNSESDPAWGRGRISQLARRCQFQRRAFFFFIPRFGFHPPNRRYGSRPRCPIISRLCCGRGALSGRRRRRSNRRIAQTMKRASRASEGSSTMLGVSRSRICAIFFVIKPTSPLSGIKCTFSSASFPKRLARAMAISHAISRTSRSPALSFCTTTAKTRITPHFR